MNNNNLQGFKKWFSDYCAFFYSNNEEDRKNIVLKEKHTADVCENMRTIANALSFNENDAMVAETVALFHDIGRFPQYRKYKTFNDSASTNHAALGAKVLNENNVLGGLTRREQDLIIRAVILHNVFTIPEGLAEDAVLFVKMIRDADKLDIWRMFTEYYKTPPEQRPSAAGLGLPDIPEYSPLILANLHRRRMSRLSDLKTLNDFRLLQLSWMFDLNFPVSFKVVLERDCIGGIAASLPDTAEIKGALSAVRDFVNERIKN